MAKDKVVELVTKEEIKKALCTITLETVDGRPTTYTGVAGYQLLGGVLVIMIHEGATFLVPTSQFTEATITGNKE